MELYILNFQEQGVYFTIASQVLLTRFVNVAHQEDSKNPRKADLPASRVRRLSLPGARTGCAAYPAPGVQPIPALPKNQVQAEEPPSRKKRKAERGCPLSNANNNRYGAVPLNPRNKEGYSEERDGKGRRARRATYYKEKSGRPTIKQENKRIKRYNSQQRTDTGDRCS